MKHHFWDRKRRTLEVDVVNTRTTLLSFDIPLQSFAIRVALVVLLAVLDGLGNEGFPNDVVAGFGLGYVQPVEDTVDLVTLQLGVHSVFEQGIASLVLELHHTFVGIARNLDVKHAFGVDDLINKSPVLGCEIIQSCDIDLVNNQYDWLVREERLDGVEEFALNGSSVYWMWMKK